MTASWRNAAGLLRRRSPPAGNPAPAERPTGWRSPRRGVPPREAGWLLLAGIAVLAPIWLGPVLPTTDGPSHLYNAFVEWALGRGEAPYLHFHAVRTAFGPNLAATLMLSVLGRWLGWAAGERLLVTVAVAGGFAVFLRLGAVRSEEGNAAVAWRTGVAAWLAQSWFVWSGFYDFALSLALFGALVLVLVRSTGAGRTLAASLLLCALYCTHLFTYAVATGLVLWLVLLDAVAGRQRAWNLVAAAVALALLPIAARLGGVGGGSIGWEGKAKAVAGLLIGDFVVSAHPMDVLAGALLMLAVWFTLASAARGRVLTLDSPLGRLGVFAAGLLLLSVVAPERFHEGSYIGARLRILGTIGLLPMIAASLPRAPRAVQWAGPLLLALLVVHGGILLRESRQVARDASAIESLLARAGGTPGSMIQGQIDDKERGLFRISAYAHLIDLIALRHRYLVLDDYEANLAIFRVRWKAVPDYTAFRAAADGWAVGVRAGDLPWPGGVLLVVHERGRPLRADGPCVALDPPVAGEAFAVTPVRLVCRAGAMRPQG